jgi:hypothetical protein
VTTALLLTQAFTREPMSHGFFSAQAAVVALLGSGCASVQMRGRSRLVVLAGLVVLSVHTYLIVAPFVGALAVAAGFAVLWPRRGAVPAGRDLLLVGSLAVAALAGSYPSIEAAFRLGSEHINALGGIADAHTSLYVLIGASALLGAVLSGLRTSTAYVGACAVMAGVAAVVVGQNLSASGAVTYYGTKSLWFLVVAPAVGRDRLRRRRGWFVGRHVRRR